MLNRNFRIGQNSLVALSLSFIVAAGLAFRLVPPLTTSGLPFYDSHGYYHDVLVMSATHTDPLLRLNGYTGELPMLNFVLFLITSYTGLGAFTVTKYIPPVLLTLVNIPAIYWLTRRVAGRRDVGLLGALLFAISDVGALRESYALPEGISTAVSLVMMISLVKFIDTRSTRWLGVLSALVLAMFTAHNLTPFIFFFSLIGIAPVLAKVNRAGLSYLLMIPFTFAAVFTAFTPLNYTIDQNAYIRYAQLIALTFSHAQAITSGSGFGSPLSGYQTGAGQSLVSFFGLHLITDITLALAFYALIRHLTRPRTDVVHAALFAWLLVTGVTFVFGILGDSLFSGNNPFFGYRTWIYLIFPASVAGALGLRDIFGRGGKVALVMGLLLVAVLGVSAPLTVHFIQTDSENFELSDAHDISVSNWLVAHVNLPFAFVYSSGGFTPTLNGTLSGADAKTSMNLLLGNATVWFTNRSVPSYVLLSQRTLDYPFATSGYTVDRAKFYTPFYDLVYSGGSDWVFWYTNLSGSQYNYTYTSLNSGD